MKRFRKWAVIVAVVAVCVLLNACTRADVTDAPPESNTVTETPTATATDTPTQTSEVTESATATSTLPPSPTPKPYTEYEVELIAITLAGECYDDQREDKRLVAETICNRVADGYWGGTIDDVVTYPSQFYGYWNQSRKVSENDIAVAEQILAEWYEQGQQPFEHGYLYFEAGDGKTNIFRREYRK
jgi:spore germination cell wall hydrolase CwlJ-like protein